jgi:hypothetical protein
MNYKITTHYINKVQNDETDYLRFMTELRYFFYAEDDILYYSDTIVNMIIL